MKKNNPESINNLNQTVFHNPASLIKHFETFEKPDTIFSYDYYLMILKNAWSDAQNDEVEKAIENLMDELEAPYIPNKIDKYFEIMIRLLRNYAYEKRNEKISKLKAKELIKVALDDFPKNMSLIDYLTTKPDGFFDVNDIDYFRFIFTSKDFKNSLKFNTITLINEIKDFANLSLNFINHNLDKKTEIVLGNPIISSETTQYYDEVYKKINEILFQDPSLEEMACSIVDQLVSYHWPFIPEGISPDELAKTTIQYIYNSLNRSNEKNESDDDVVKLIERAMKEQ